MRDFYLGEEPYLIESIRRGDRPAAVESINRVLVHVYARGAEDSEQLKGLLLELVVMMSRAAVDAGASQTVILGMGYRHLVELSKVHDDEELARWLRSTFFRIIDAVQATISERPDPVITKTLRVLRESCAGSLTRQDVAKTVGVSPSHLAELLKERLGRSFSELLAEARLARACDLLKTTNDKIADIAVDSGFSDQSHLTRVFREVRGLTPRQFRAHCAEGTASLTE
ncbi:MAG: helix-turn-helix transcriptional regulator [Terrimicrobiaceae bacterium]